jgi:hypothetical protein
MPLVHPAIFTLLLWHAWAIVRRMGRAFSTRRRRLLSFLGIALAIIWLSNAVLSIIFREPLDPERFRDGVPLALLTYSLWHVLRTAFKRPPVGMEWSPAETELLCGAPLTRRDRLVYRFVSIFHAATVKAMCFAFLMWPDLRRPLAGFIGLLLGLLFVDFWRMLVEIVAWGMPDRAYRYYRAGAAAIVGAVTASAIIIAFCWPATWQDAQTPASFGLLQHLAAAAVSLRHTIVGQILEWPLDLFSNVVVGSGDSTSILISLGGAFAITALMVWLVVRSDALFEELATARERLHYEAARSTVAEPTGDVAASEIMRGIAWARIPWAGGKYLPLAWRQGLGVLHHRSSIALSLAVPGVLACLPILVYRNPYHILLNVVGALVFYSFLLLPTALKFDFRRDLDRIVILKSLPLRPLSIVCGQLTTPVLLSTFYQNIVLLVVAALRPIPRELAVASVLLFIPLNVLIFAIENLIFLWYPYRVQQEGLAIFLRTTLTFTAKGLLFGIALAFTVCWTFAAGMMSAGLANLLGIRIDHRVVFGIGMWVFVCVCAGIAMAWLAKAFDRFDLSEDMPA